MSDFKTCSVFTSTRTFTPTSTITGLGFLSGKAIKRVGTVIVNGIDALLIRRRLGQLEATLDQTNTTTATADPSDVQSLYSDLLELSRPVYSLSIRTRAFRVIMGKVGGMDFQDLAIAVANWPIYEAYDLLKAMILCFRNPSTTDLLNSVGDNGEKLKRYCNAGLDAYKACSPYKTSASPGPMSTRKSNLCIAFLLYLGLTSSFSKDPAFSRLLMELNIPLFITETYPNILKPKHRWSMHLLPARLLLHALIENLDPVKDTTSVAQLQKLLRGSSPAFAISPSRQLIAGSSVHSKISQLQSVFRGRELKKPNILLLGSGDSGKTTMAKQFLKAVRGPYTDTERAKYIEPVIRSTLDAFSRLISAQSVWNQEDYKDVEALLRRAYNAPSLDILEWIEDRCQYLLHNRYQILGGTEFFLDALPRVLAEDYLPSDADISRCYTMTKGIHPVNFVIDGSQPFTLFDFGGRRWERRMWLWMDCFRHAGLAIFVASLDAYNEGLLEQPTVGNRMQDSLVLFESIVNSKWFTGVPIVLFLNKSDLFSQKISRLPLPEEHFPDYHGGNDSEAALEYIIGQYVSRNRCGLTLKIYLTSAIDDAQIIDVMKEVLNLKPPTAYLDLGMPDSVIQDQVAEEQFQSIPGSPDGVIPLEVSDLKERRRARANLEQFRNILGLPDVIQVQVSKEPERGQDNPDSHGVQFNRSRPFVLHTYNVPQAIENLI
ncbi:G-protein alpha subunit-domain-containing protein [Rhodocollybia butyracea]|uniref:G-protein alpha subunit-domain-containing protein n=1 Tax=Rhodocollybia butyracea TaxID=206335 RepID=A0A9P5U6D5_9AGAR|nr:G-protein alpha subunit-domain-containing protein [Rhodocollybia butyracea]